MGKQERDSLKSKLTEVQAVVQSQNVKVKHLKKATDQAQYERDSLKIMVTELEKVIQDESEQRATRLKIKEQSSQTVDPRGDGGVMLGAAHAGVALGAAGKAGIILSSLSK
jgi:hypothetical protein